MKYTYAYKTSDGVRHEAAMDAPSREAVFETLRAQGIRAIKVVAADGSRANGAVRGFRKRTVAVIVGLAAAVVVALLLSLREKAEELSTLSSKLSVPSASPRHQLYGDPVVIGEIERGKLEAFLPRPGDRLLAWFAQPGRVLCPRDTNRVELHRLSVRRIDEIRQVAESDVAIAEDDPREVRELKQIVNGIREELRNYLANGNGTIRSFWGRLIERTHQETQIYERTRRELENEADPAVWEEKNDALRCLGLRTIPNPKDAE